MASIQVTQVQSLARGKITDVGSLDINVMDIKGVHKEKHYTLVSLPVGQIAVRETPKEILARIQNATRLRKEAG